MATTTIKDGFQGGSDNQLKVNPDGSINVNGGGGNASVGPTGATAPTSATEIGGVDASGKLVGLKVDPSGKLLVDTSGSSTVSGTVNTNVNGLSTFQTSQYTVGTTSVRLTPTPLSNRSAMSIKAVISGNAMVYIGNSSAVTSSTGYPLFNGDSLQLDLTAGQAVYAIASAGSQLVAVMEIGN
jgi:hypothetical protein